MLPTAQDISVLYPNFKLSWHVKTIITFKIIKNLYTLIYGKCLATAFGTGKNANGMVRLKKKKRKKEKESNKRENVKDPETSVCTSTFFWF